MIGLSYYNITDLIKIVIYKIYETDIFIHEISRLNYVNNNIQNQVHMTSKISPIIKIKSNSKISSIKQLKVEVDRYRKEVNKLKT